MSAPISLDKLTDTERTLVQDIWAHIAHNYRLLFAAVNDEATYIQYMAKTQAGLKRYTQTHKTTIMEAAIKTGALSTDINFRSRIIAAAYELFRQNDYSHLAP